MINIIFHWVMYARKIPVSLAIKRGPEQPGFVPMWPPLFEDPKVFVYCVKVLMLRLNDGQKFEESDFRPLVIESVEAFERVVVEIAAQLCGWLAHYDCYKSLEDFLTIILRFPDVIQNYVHACCARIVFPDD